MGLHQDKQRYLESILQDLQVKGETNSFWFSQAHSCEERHNLWYMEILSTQMLGFAFFWTPYNEKQNDKNLKLFAAEKYFLFFSP